MDLSKKSDLYWNLGQGIPFPTGTVNKIYSSHVLEHFSFSELRKLLPDCLRALAPEGQFSVCVPNAELFISAYTESRELDTSKFFQPAFHSTSKLDFVNYIAYMDGHHKYMFDKENLIQVLTMAGFVNVRLRSFDPQLDLEGRRHESIYAEGCKPPANECLLARSA